ncbi:ATP-binding cassette domain-containing protein [Mitsuokella sp. WILCCON 0060]|uniref:ATP-binding cassette domain-containing protein n=1 Tax=Mitsuokella sp. WILCCON 0060 TaxID=3345341 RepID=UPI003F1B9213
MEIIEAKGLTKIFTLKDGTEVRALSGIDLEVPEGQLTALVGPDGAGKTTLMRLVCGLMTKTSGTLQVVGLDVTEKPQAVQDLLSYMPQKFGLYEDLTVQENLDLYADLHGVPQDIREQRFAHLLAMTELAPFTKRLAGKLSGGMKQKLGLACTLVRSPKLLLLDEPTVGVDPLSRRELWQILQQLVHEERLSVLVSTAYMEEAALCEKVYVLNHGHFLKIGTPDELREVAKGTCYKVTPPAGMPLRSLQSRLLAEKDVIDAVPSGGVVRFITRGNPDELAPLKRRSLRAEAIEPRLEDGFMTLLKEDENKAGQPVSQAAASAENMGAFSGRSPMDAPVEIEVQDLVRKFGDFTAVSHTSFSVHRGEVFGLLGPNGAGKTTTFRMLCGLLPATSGKLSVAGVNLRTARIEARAKVGYVAQKFSLYSSLSVYENLRFFGGAYGLFGAHLYERIQAVMQEFHLQDVADHAAGSLPGGYKQRLSMAAALIHEPKILFLDEPTSGIDPLARRTFWREITALSEKGTTIIITTHFMEEAEYCDRFMIQDHGKMLVLGSPAEIRQRMHLGAATMDDIFVAIVERSRAEKNEAKGAES